MTTLLDFKHHMQHSNTSDISTDINKKKWHISHSVVCIFKQMSNGKMGRKIELTFHLHCYGKRPGTGLTFQRNLFCPVCCHKTASILTPNKKGHQHRLYDAVQ